MVIDSLQSNFQRRQIWPNSLVECFFKVNYHNRHSLAPSQQWKHQNNVQNLFKVGNKDTRTWLLTSFWCLYCSFLTYFTHCLDSHNIVFFAHEISENFTVFSIIRSNNKEKFSWQKNIAYKICSAEVIWDNHLEVPKE